MISLYCVLNNTIQGGGWGASLRLDLHTIIVPKLYSSAPALKLLNQEKVPHPLPMYFHQQTPLSSIIGLEPHPPHMLPNFLFTTLL